MSNYTNSGLVSYVKLSPNHSGLRTHAIDTITVHTMAGNMSVQTCGALFANSARQASSNYGIDSTGAIAMYVEEQNRSWCSANQANDQRAITIEVASTNTTDYAPSDQAYASLIRLLVDICRRNDIEKLVWSTDKNTRVNHLNGCNMTVHRDYKNKSCPGEWLYSHMGDIADKVNSILTATTVTEVADPTDAEGGEAVLINTEKEYWDFFKSKGLNDYAASAVMANLFAESGLRSNNLQNSFETKLGMTDAEYTEAVDNGTYTNFAKDGAGYGLAQWTFWSRKQALLDYVKAAGKSIGDDDAQLGYLWQELSTSYKGLLTLLEKATSVKAASDLVLIKFENPGGYGDNMPDSYRNTRAAYAQEYYDKYAEKTASKLPYMVRITTSALNIRKGPGTNYDKTGCIRDHGVYTIVAESAGTGANLWGQLKSGAGWIAIDDKWNVKV